MGRVVCVYICKQRFCCVPLSGFHPLEIEHQQFWQHVDNKQPVVRLLRDVIVNEAKATEFWQAREWFEVTQVEKGIVCQHYSVHVRQRVLQVIPDPKNKIVRYQQRLQSF